MGLFAQIKRFFSFFFQRKAQSVRRAADEQFTKDEQGISDAVAITHGQLRAKYEKMFNAMGKAQTSLQHYIKREAEMTEVEQKQDRLFQGAKAKSAKLAIAGDTAGAEAAKNDAVGYKADLDKVRADLEKLRADIVQQKKELAESMPFLKQLRDKLAALPAEELKLIHDFHAHQARIEAAEEMAGIRSLDETTPLDLVRQNNEEMRAKANVASEMAYGLNRDKQEEYLAAGEEDEVQKEINAMIAAKEAEKKASTETAPTETNTEKESRPKNF